MIQAGLPLARTRPGSPAPGAKRDALGRRAERREALGVGEVPDGRRDELAGPVPGEGVDVADRPAGVGADPLQAEPHRLVDRRRLVRRHRHRLQQRDRGRLLAERDLGLPSLGDVAPRPDDLEGVACSRRGSSTARR